MSNETCEKHDACIESLRITINEIKIAQSKMDGSLAGFTDSVHKFVDALRNDIYSPGGLVERVGNHGLQVGLQWGLLAVIVVAAIIQWIIK